MKLVLLPRKRVWEAIEMAGALEYAHNSVNICKPNEQLEKTTTTKCWCTCCCLYHLSRKNHGTQFVQIKMIAIGKYIFGGK